MGKFSKKINIIIICIVFCLILGIFGARKLLNYDFIEKTFLNVTNLKLELINPKTTIGLNLSVKFKADKINIYNKEKTQNFASIDSVDTYFRPIGLLFNKINIKKANFKDITINLSLKNGELDIISALNKDFLNSIKKTKPIYNLLNFKAEKLTLNYTDKAFKTSVELDNTKFNISKSKHQFIFLTNGKIDTSINKNLEKATIAVDIASKYPFEKNKKEDLKTNVEIKNINLLTFNELVQNYISKDIKEFRGNVDLYLKTQDENQKGTINIFNHKIILKDNKIIVPYKEKISISSLFNINKDSLFLKDLTLKSNELNVKVNGKIDKLSSKSPKIDLLTDIKNTQLNHFVYYFPDNLIFYRPQGIPTLKNSNFYGVIDGNMEIKNEPVDAKGNIKVSNVHIPKVEKPYKQNDVYITLLGDRMRVYSKVYTPQNEYVIIDGISILDTSMQGSYNVSSSKNIDLVFAKKYLIPIQQIIGFNIGPVPNMEITGIGNINIKTKGSLFDPQVFGEFSANNATASIKNINTTLTKGYCKLVFDNRTVHLKDVRGKINNADFTLKGSGNTKGELKLEAIIGNIPLGNLLEIFNETIITKEFSKITKNISATSGKADVDLILEGVVPNNNYEDSEFFKYLNPSGKLTLKNNKIALKNQIKAEKIKGTIDFGKEQKAIIESFLGGSKFNIILNSKTPIEKILKDRNIVFDTNIVSAKFNSVDIYNQIKNLAPFSKYLRQINVNKDYIRFFAKTNLNIAAKFNIDNYNIQNPTIFGYLTGLNDKNSAFVFNGGNVKFNGKKAILDKINISLPYGDVKINGDINNPVSAEPNFNVRALLEDINLSKLNTFFPKIKFKQSYLKNGEIILKNHDIKFNNINISYEEMPLFVNAQIKNIFKNTSIQTKFSTIINENTTDSLINPYLISPLKIKGEIPIKGFIKGTNENYTVSFKTKIPKNSDVSFMGANVGDVNYNRELNGNIEVVKDVAKINELKLIKFITNQNNKTNPLTMLKIDGKIKQIKEDIFYDNLRIATSSPMNVRMLNLIFKKSLLKKGVFDCNIALNGNSKAPKIIGKAYFSDLDIPLYSTKVDSIDFDMSKSIISGKIIAKSKDNDVDIAFRAPNNLVAPFTIDELNIESNKLNINSLLNSLIQQAPKSDIALKQDVIIKPQDIIISKGSVDLKEIQYDKIEAKNLKSHFNFKDNVLTLENMIFDIAQGKITASGKYNLSSTKLNLKAAIEECNSNLLVYQFLHLSDQIFGKMNGNIELTGSNLNTPQNIKNINSKITFSIENGKMTKLGSLEYLLRAGNIIKNGLLNLSLNNLIQILTPYKTGEFENIKGNLTISKGCVKNLEIMTKGKNMSLLIEGNYDILKNFADANIYGKLSQNVSNSLGMFGNASIKQIFDSITMNKIKSENNLEIINKIPSIENENPTPRYFKARVLGDINKENYIKSFNWEIK